jgi:hypothetical protein
MALRKKGNWVIWIKATRQIAGFSLKGSTILRTKTCSRVIGIDSQVGEKKRFATGLVTASIRFHRHKYGINLGQHLGIIALQDPAFLGGAVLVEYAQVDGVFSIRPAPPPGLECPGAF